MSALVHPLLLPESLPPDSVPSGHGRISNNASYTQMPSGSQKLAAQAPSSLHGSTHSAPHISPLHASI